MPVTAPIDASGPISEPPITRLFPGSVVRLAVEDVYGGLSFPSRGERPYVLVNMVASLDGKATVGGKASPIGSRTDREIMTSLRAGADAVMVGAGTLRAERLSLAVPEDLARARASSGRRSQPWGVVAAGASGDVPLDDHLLGPPPEDLVVLVPPGSPRKRLASLTQARACVEEVVPREGAPSPRLDLVAALGILKGRYGVRTLLVEGGPALNQALLAVGLVDEVFLTLAPKLLGGEGPGGPGGALTMLEGPALPGGARATALISIHLSANDELFLRYTVGG